MESKAIDALNSLRIDMLQSHHVSFADKVEACIGIVAKEKASSISASTKANHLRIKELEKENERLSNIVMSISESLSKSVDVHGKLK